MTGPANRSVRIGEEQVGITLLGNSESCNLLPLLFVSTTLGSLTSLRAKEAHWLPPARLNPTTRMADLPPKSSGREMFLPFKDSAVSLGIDCASIPPQVTPTNRQSRICKRTVFTEIPLIPNAHVSSFLRSVPSSAHDVPEYSSACFCFGGELCRRSITGAFSR
jgi:hypothetical protein